MRIAESGVGDGQRGLGTNLLSPLLRTELQQLIAGTARQWLGPVEGRNLVERTQLGRALTVWLIDRDVSNVVDDAARLIHCRRSLEQVWVLWDEAGVHAGGYEVRLAQQGAQEADVGGHAGDGELVERALRTSDGLFKGGAATSHLHQQRVEVRRDFRTYGGGAVETHARAARRTVGGKDASVWAEAVCWVLSGDAALQRRAGELDVLLVEPKFLERDAGRNLHLGLHNVHAGDFLGHGVLNLHTRIHLDEDVVALLIHEELHGASALVVDVLAELYGIGTDAVTQLRIQRGGRGDLDDLLVAALHGAVTLEEVNDVALGVRQNLHLDVLGLDDGRLKIDVPIAECCLCLAGSLSTLGLELGLVLDETHAASAATGDGLDKYRKGEVLGVTSQYIGVRGRLGVLQGRQASFLSGGHSGGLVTGQVQGLRGRADELDAIVLARTS